ncbi:MAG TPA: hypothetical protein PLN69_05965 [bacterium]|nr:hypothetical protein [bacterium]
MEDKNHLFLIEAYRAHKNELIDRRRFDLCIGAVAMLFYIISIRILNTYPPSEKLFSGIIAKCVATLVFVFITDVIIYSLVKNYSRICSLEQMIRKIDGLFGFFGDGAPGPSDSLYPEKWKTYGAKSSVSVTTRALIPIFFGLIVIIMIWLRQF